MRGFAREDVCWEGRGQLVVEAEAEGEVEGEENGGLGSGIGNFVRVLGMGFVWA